MAEGTHVRMVLAEQLPRSATSNLNIALPLLQLQEQIRGSVLLPQDPRYAAVRSVRNTAFDCYPAMIVQVDCAEDVAAVVRFARAEGLEIAVRGGGHSPAGFGTIEGGVVIDMSRMKRVEVDVERGIARAEAGLRNGEYLTALQPYGLVSPVGDASTTGLAGMTLGAGYGFLSGKYGLAIDNLHAVELVTAEGDLLRASEDEHPDLFWAVRGGGGNFGVLTTLEFRVHHLPQVLSGLMMFPYARATEVMHTYYQVTANSPDELTVYAAIATPPGQDTIVVLMPCWCGDIAQGEEVLAPFRALEPFMDTVAPVPYIVPSSFADPFAPENVPHIERWRNLTALNEELLDQLVALADPACAQMGFIIIKQMNGAATRLPNDATAFAHRTLPYMVLSVAIHTTPEQQQHATMWTAAVCDVLRDVTAGVYGGGCTRATPEEVYGANLPRLRQVKQQYDPQNIFHSNYNILPAGHERVHQ